MVTSQAPPLAVVPLQEAAAFAPQRGTTATHRVHARTYESVPPKLRHCQVQVLREGGRGQKKREGERGGGDLPQASPSEVGT